MDPTLEFVDPAPESEEVCGLLDGKVDVPVVDAVTAIVDKLCDQKLSLEADRDEWKRRFESVHDYAIKPVRGSLAVRCLLCQGQGLETADFHINECPLKEA